MFHLLCIATGDYNMLLVQSNLFKRRESLIIGDCIDLHTINTCCHSRKVLNKTVTMTLRWSTLIIAKGVGVNHNNSPISLLMLHVVAGQTDKTAQRANQIGLTHTARLSHYTLCNYKTNDHRPTGATDSLSCIQSSSFIKRGVAA